MKAIIQKVELRRMNDIWKKHKPQGLGFSDNDAIVLTLKTKDGKKITETFYCRLKGDGTLGRSMTHASEKRQQTLQKFIKKYISKEKRYNIRENIDKWKGKEIEVEEIDGSLIITI